MVSGIQKSQIRDRTNLSGKTALITGGSRGIGAAIAEALAEKGTDIVIVDIENAETIAGKIRSAGRRVWQFQIDISDHHNVEAMIRNFEDTEAPINILVNNAGIITRGTVLDISYEDWDRVIAVNVTGTFNCCKAVIPFMVKRREGQIINITSVAGKTGDITAAPAYGTSKGAVNALTKSLARQLACYGIRVNAVAPHAIKTDMSAQWSEETRRSIIDDIPLARLGSPEDVAQAVIFLASDAAGFITGEILDINGGYLMD